MDRLTTCPPGYPATVLRTTVGQDGLERRPEGTDDATVGAVGKLSEALETVERARGALYTFHQLIGHADLQLGEAATMLRSAGHPDIAER